MPPRSGVQDAVFLVASAARLTEAMRFRWLLSAMMLSKVPRVQRCSLSVVWGLQQCFVTFGTFRWYMMVQISPDLACTDPFPPILATGPGMVTSCKRRELSEP